MMDAPFTIDEYWLIFRLLAGTLSAFLVSLCLGPSYIRQLSAWQPKQPVRKDVPKTHLVKNGTPTSGGVLILTSYLVASFLWVNWHHFTTKIISFTLVYFGSIGLLDDYYKIGCNKQGGLSVYYKYGLQSLGAILVGVLLYRLKEGGPFQIGYITVFKPWLFVVWAYWVIVGSSNAFNLTDGLDGLVSLQTILIATGLLILSLIKAKTNTIDVQEITILCGILIGSSSGFLWYNVYPARVFMGDTGALAVGASLGVIALMLHQEILFASMSLIPLLETVSVIVQVLCFKATKKRLFRMAPLHHHFELIGIKEPNIVKYFSLFTALIVALCLFFIIYESTTIV